MTEQKQLQLSKPEQNELKRQTDTITREKTEGRYTLARAAKIIYSAEDERINLAAVINVPTPQQVMLPNSGTNERRILDGLAKAVISKELKSYWPGSKFQDDSESCYGVSYQVLEIYDYELNHWMESHVPNVKYRFNIAGAHAGKVEAVPVVSPSIEAWRANARHIGERIYQGKPSLNVEEIAEKTHKEMTNRKGEPGMTGRGGKVPSADTIKRHALAGIKAQGIRALP